tara:strand:+ start:132 stop:479 length:348 start_codon:yes stop_codon:yes gene_type:complete
MKLTRSEYIEILNFYNIKFNQNMPLNLLRKSVEKIIATKLCRCIKKVNNETHESRAVGICNKSVIKNKNLAIYKFSCKKRPHLQVKNSDLKNINKLYKTNNNIRLNKTKKQKKKK